MCAHLFVAAILIPACLPAQNRTLNDTTIWDRTTETTSRGRNGSDPGFVAQGFQHGFQSGLRSLLRVRYVMQDQDDSTQERWSVGTSGIRDNGDAWGRSRVFDSRNRHFRPYATNLTLPKGQSRIVAYLITHNALANAVPVIRAPTISRVFHTWEFQERANWTTDGLSIHVGHGTNPLAGRLCGWARHSDIPRAEGSPSRQLIERLAWTGVANRPRPTWNDVNWRLMVSYDEPVLKGLSANSVYNAPCPDPNPGYASIDPNFNNNGNQNPPRFDDPVWEVRSIENAADSRIAIFLFSSFTLGNGGLALPGVGTLHTDTSTPTLLVARPMQWNTARTSFPMGTNTALRNAVANLGCLATQAAIVNLTKHTMRLTNPWNMRTLNLPPGWRRATCYGTGSGCVSIPRTAFPAVLPIRNDGIGEVAVQPFRNTMPIGQPILVGERSAAFLRLPAGINRVTVCSPNNDDATRPTEFIYQ